MSRENKGKYVYPSAKDIGMAVNGDNNAMSRIIDRYQNYGYTCLRNAAREKYNLDLGFIPMDDLMQIVWIRFVSVVRKKFVV